MSVAVRLADLISQGTHASHGITNSVIRSAMFFPLPIVSPNLQAGMLRQKIIMSTFFAISLAIVDPQATRDCYHAHLSSDAPGYGEYITSD